MNIRLHGILAVTLGATPRWAQQPRTHMLEPNTKTPACSAKSSHYWQVVKNHSGETYLRAHRPPSTPMIVPAPAAPR